MTRNNQMLLALPLLGGAAGHVSKSGAGKLPSLGWNSWNMYGCDIDEAKFLAAAQKMIDTGLKDAGYNYVNVDDCWSLKTGRSDDGHIQVNMTRFPNGLDGLASKIHDMGLKIGIYSTAGTATCAGYPASLEHEETDAADWASWGIDYLKYDNCNVPDNWKDEYVFCHPDYVKTNSNGTCTPEITENLAPPGYDWRTSKSFDRFKRMKDALDKQDHEIVYNLCIWGTADVFSWGKDIAISWRMSNDINAHWDTVTHIINLNSFYLNSVDFWSHNDADMLEVGNNLSDAEARSHFALWAAMKSPLLIGTDLDKLSQSNIDILKNRRLLAFSQDETVGAPAKPYKWGINPDWTYNSTNPAEFWAGDSENGILVLMLNTLGETDSKTAVWSEIPGLDGNCKHRVTNVWTGEDLGCLGEYKADVESHDTAAILVSKHSCH
ncbi:Alpha-galactosidase [Purpureocillium takamizusanense]|uniref:Alpha-galactosidase n=1 Tax=Purpureocillium takamizusanense TaxID=2060973 RepID=A0A9Q8QCU9_9HYPO|nr:Alpha-galactosidase [Purpureocillium takamizusanense]UNI17038.1 Alpha-galactosidase [Purpureocillium takamizusanense]